MLYINYFLDKDFCLCKNLDTIRKTPAGRCETYPLKMKGSHRNVGDTRHNRQSKRVGQVGRRLMANNPCESDGQFNCSQRGQKVRCFEGRNPIGYSGKRVKQHFRLQPTRRTEICQVLLSQINIMTFHGLKIGDLFLITYDFSGLHCKIDHQTAINLHTRQLCRVHANKKIESRSSLQYDKRLFLAWQNGIPVIVRKVSGGFELFRLLIVKSDFCRDALELQGIPYGSQDEVDIILSRLKIHLEKSLALADTLATLREA